MKKVSHLDTVNILGIPFFNTTMDDFIKIIDDRMHNQEKTFIVTANPEIVMHTKEDAQFKNILQEANYIIPDGIGIVKAAKTLGQPLPERVAGYDTMLRLLEVANKEKKRVYFFGAKEENLKKMLAKIEEMYPNLIIAGSHHGYYDPKDETVIREIQETEPDFIFVALGFPRQEKWIDANIHKCKSGVFMGVGGSFDVISGTVKRAPKIWRSLHIEWLYRLVSQPSRWRRMLAIPKFMMEVRKSKKTVAKDNEKGLPM